MNILTPEFFLGQTIFFMESVDLFLKSEFMKPASVFFGLSFGGGTDFSVAMFFSSELTTHLSTLCLGIIP